MPSNSSRNGLSPWAAVPGQTGANSRASDSCFGEGCGCRAQESGELQYICCIVRGLQRIRHSPPELSRLFQSSSDLLTFTMGQLGIVVPFTVFTEYRDRRVGGGTIAVAKPGAARRSGEAAEAASVPAQDGVTAELPGLPRRPVHRSAEREGGSGEAAEPGHESGCVDATFTSAETTVPAEPTPERIPS